ncbi:phosphatidylinositol-specific phospholipase C domain-containing protein [Hymenobacter sediminis]|uniref:phosphatidylinositol-specific phospholipase C n=1 Tax=Hymenobacter sediminis TaxID=2218621 RepID=UPI000DA6A8AA|nr:phosphatidylinositol-specific phospholipase C [Hymenobacter sediminis]RPD45743.1 phosphatidylinositol-specific phospholipase C domain-containing protein [Hymenobacter sediminis]
MKPTINLLAPLTIAASLLFTSCDQKETVSPAGATATSSQDAVAAYTLANWMGSVDATLSLAQLSIPGTHDSGARFESISGTAKCQNLTIGEQLNAGVRFLDVRCRHIDNSFTIHHGAVYQNLNFSDVRAACLEFLRANPTECIIMSIKEEHTPSNNTRTFEQTLNAFLQENPDKWYVGESVPTLGQVRGKIVLLRRYAATTPKGVDATNWADNTSFEINTSAAQLKVQDQYKVSDNNAKWTAMNTLLTEAKASTNNRLILNYASGYKPGLFGIPSITTVSNNINPRLTTFFTAQGKGRFGIIPMDFAEASRNSLIVKTNF